VSACAGEEMADVEIRGGWVSNVVVNGVDIATIIEASSTGRMPEREKMRPATLTGSGRRGDPWSGWGGSRRAGADLPRSGPAPRPSETLGRSSRR